MPKQKSHKATAKRFTVTKSGLVKRAQAYKRHKLTSKTTKRTRNLRKTAYVNVIKEAQAIKTLIPY